MKTNKSVLIAGGLLLGLGIGFLAGWFQFSKLPQAEIEKIAAKQEKEMQDMTSAGELVAVTPGKVKIAVSEGKATGKSIEVKVGDHTGVQIGTTFFNIPGEKPDLTQFFEIGDDVHIMSKDGHLILIHRNPKPQEQLASPNIVQPPVAQR